jgi:heterotetrameric sarcosine oxidase delta subunit
VELHCPFCGVRDISEFQFRTHAALGSSRSTFESTYERINDPLRSTEYWQHVHGCRAWLLIERNPSNDHVLSVRFLSDVTG